MYKEEVPAIVDWLENKGADGLVTVGSFVLCTIQTPLSRVGLQLEDVRLRGYDSPYLWGFKRKGYYHLSLYRRELHEMLCPKGNPKRRSLPREEAFYRLLATPGLGLAKTGFLMQLYGWETGCIDIHNATRLALKPPKLSLDLKPRTKQQKVLEYLTLCDSCGGSEKLWDDWCSWVAGNSHNSTLKTAEDVSRYHARCICVDDKNDVTQ